MFKNEPTCNAILRFSPINICFVCESLNIIAWKQSETRVVHTGRADSLLEAQIPSQSYMFLARPDPRSEVVLKLNAER